MAKLTFADIGKDYLDAFALGDAVNLAHTPLTALGKKLIHRDSADPANLRFATLFNVFNGAVYGDTIGMPAWVMINCVFQNTVLIGIQGPARHLSQDIRQKIDQSLSQLPQADLAHPLTDDEIVPLAEACAAQTLAPDRIHAFSLYSTVPGMGTIAKALMLDCHRQNGVRYQTGTAQYDNSSLAIHTKFGALDILQPRVSLHTKYDRTFIYGCAIPDEKTLLIIAEGGKSEVPDGQSANVIQFDLNDRPQYQTITERHHTGTHRYQLVQPGIDMKTKINPLAEINIEVENT